MRLTPANQRFERAADPVACTGIFARGLGDVASGVDWRKLRVTKALPHKDGGFALQYEAPLLDEGVLHVGGHLTGSPDQKPDWAGESPGTYWDSGIGLALATPASDPRLGRDIAKLPGALGEFLSLGLGWPGNGVVRPQIMAYRLAKRCVVLAESQLGGKQAVIKFARPKIVRRSTDRLEALASAGIPVPSLLLKSSSDRFLVMDFLQGQGLNSLKGYQCIEGHKETGRLLSRLHEADLPTKETRTAHDEFDQLKRWVPLTAALFPQLAEGLELGLRVLEDLIPGPPERVTTVHRDFYDKQVFSSESGFVLLDFDTISSGDPNLDLGNFLAHVRLRRKQYITQKDALNLAGQAFLQGYGGLPGSPADRAWWQAAALLRLVVVYSLRPHWQNLVPSLLEDVHVCLREPERPL